MGSEQPTPEDEMEVLFDLIRRNSHAGLHHLAIYRGEELVKHLEDLQRRSMVSEFFERDMRDSLAQASLVASTFDSMDRVGVIA